MMFDNDILSISEIVKKVSISDLIINVKNIDLAKTMIYKKFPNCKLTIFRKNNIVIGGVI